VLSAVIPQETLDDFAAWLDTGPDGVIEETWRPSLQRVAKFEWAGKTGVLRYAAEREVPMLSEFVPGVVRERTYRFINEETGRWNTRRFPAQDNKGQTAAELASKFSELGPVLIFCSQTNFAESVAKALEARLDLMERVDETIPSSFRTPRTQSVRVAREWLGNDHFVTRLLKRGIALHHGKLPDALRKSVEDDFRNRRYRVLVATNTLAQGVNLPVRTVIVHSVWRTYGDQTRERLPARDYWNIAGRAGRAREETEGTVIHIVASRNDNRDYEQFLARRDDVEPVESASFQVLQALVAERISEDTSQLSSTQRFSAYWRRRALMLARPRVSMTSWPTHLSPHRPNDATCRLNRCGGPFLGREQWSRRTFRHPNSCRPTAQLG
jgi:helicase